ncbi:hypothetical protein H9Y04_32500 [Streptomyces sp. TRM66268-LWL]|uniref:CdiI immunity protein domain-containing protein n=1 Tax=Streptomyces polyasparticus TaxID=2767826 RepID=A0ABR7SPB0_9ACTN|nr:hypothetical protein [Streptomyces polyasparticus]MBC9717258.1 hypothetical protein [Streptomyces polyasparticus]
MPIHAHFALSTGPLFHLAALAAEARTSPSADPLEWQVLRYARLTGYASPKRSPAWELQHAAFQLDYFAETFDAGPFASCAPQVRETWATAAADDPVPAFMSGLAALLRMADREPPAGYGEVPLAGWEAKARYPRLYRGIWPFSTGDYDAYEQAIAEVVESEHPDYCHEDLAELLAQCVEVLELMQNTPEFAASIVEHIPPHTVRVLPDLVAAAAAHFAREHTGGAGVRR